MENSKIDFSYISSINYSTNTQSPKLNNNIYSNDNILYFRENENEINKKEAKRNKKNEFEKIMNQTKEKFKSLSLKSDQIIDSKNFSFKNIIKNSLNIQSISQNVNKSLTKEENYCLNKKNENNMNINNNINQFKLFENSFDNITEKNNKKIIGIKRKKENDKNMNLIEEEIKIIFKEILIIWHEISTLNNDIIKKEEKYSLNSDNESIKKTLIINNNPIVTIYFNGDEVNKIYVFKNNKNLINENDILLQLKQIKKNMSIILNKLKKN